MRHLASAIALSAILVFSASCHDHTATPPDVIRATYSGAEHQFWSEQGLFIYQSAGYAVVQAIDTVSHDSLSVAFIGTNTGTYTVGHGSNNSISLTHGAAHYSSQGNGSHGSIILSRLDPATAYATGTFSAVLINTANRRDSLAISDGSISVPYQ